MDGGLYDGADHTAFFSIVSAEIEGTPSNSIIQTNPETIDANPNSHQLFCHSSVAGSGSITYDVSFDGGTSWDTGNELNTSNPSEHTGSNIILKLNLNGVGEGNTSEASDYALMLEY